MPMSPAQQAVAKAIGSRVRRIRTAMPGAPSQETIARKAGIGLQTMNRVETGARMADFETYEAIADALEVHVVDLLKKALSDPAARTGYFERLRRDLGQRVAATA